MQCYLEDLFLSLQIVQIPEERGGSVVEYLTWDQGVVGMSYV